MPWIARLLRIGRIATAVTLLLLPASLDAATITYRFSGATERIDDITGGHADIPAGTPFSGSFTYDSQLPLIDKTPLEDLFGYKDDNPTTKDYGSPPWDPPLPGDVLNATISVDGLPSFAPGNPAHGIITVRNDEIFGWPPTLNDTFILGVSDLEGHWLDVKLVDPTGQALASTQLPATLDLAKFSQAYVQYRSEAGLVFGPITSLEVAAVPEPSILAVLVLGGLGLAAARRKVRGRRPIG